MTLKIHISSHNDDLHKGTSKRNLAGGVAGLDSSGNLSSGIISGLLNRYAITNDLLHSNDSTQINSTQNTYKKVKTITLNTLYRTPETIRIKFDLKTTWSIHNAYGRIYKNGVALGTERITNNTSYVTYSEDLSFEDGDTLELWTYNIGWNAAYSYTRNLRIYGISQEITIAEGITDNRVGEITPFSATNS
ncbi:MAG: hypothetical protein KAI81_04340 [Candidatus Marinimicrobia bacterium]|nr:hypothetical protein [Candidatus Neomarinimicrobiota bacterium]